MTIKCSATPCPIILSAECVHYEGANLVYSGIQTNDNLEAVFQKLDVLIHDSLTETDPIFEAWLIATPPLYSFTETDPVFSGWDKSTGVSITESQISDLQSYITDISGEDLSTADNSTSQFITAADIPAIPTDVSELTDTTGVIPTNTNELTNGAGFITAGDIPAETDPDFNSWLSTTPPAYPGDIPVKATFTEVNTGTDDGKFATASSLYNSYYNYNRLLALSISL